MSIEIDHVIIVCKGCRSERKIYPDRPLRGSEEVIEWIRKQSTACICGADECNLKMHARIPAGESPDD